MSRVKSSLLRLRGKNLHSLVWLGVGDTLNRLSSSFPPLKTWCRIRDIPLLSSSPPRSFCPKVWGSVENRRRRTRKKRSLCLAEWVNHRIRFGGNRMDDGFLSVVFLPLCPPSILFFLLLLFLFQRWKPF